VPVQAIPRKRVTSVPPAIQLTLTPSPFVQRVWVALEAKGLQYQYIEVDPYKKPQALLDVNPRGLVPGLRHGDWGCGESTVLMEYVRTNSYFSYGFTLINIQLEDLGAGQPLLPQGNPQLRATCRLWSDHVDPPNLSEKCTN